MSLVAKYALLPEEIERESLKRVEAYLPDSLFFIPRRTVRRLPHRQG